MKKKIIISIIIIIVAVGAAGLFIFQKPRTVLIENKASGEKSADLSAEDKKDTAGESVALEAENNSVLDPEKAAEKNNIKPEAKNNILADDEKENAEIKKSGIINRLVSWGYQKADGRKIDTIVIHSSYNSLGGNQYDVEKIIDIYKSYGVAAHYIIDREGKIYKLVEEKNIAYHAGESQVPDGRTGVNNFSIGIEMINTKTDAYAQAQYGAVKNLVADIKGRYKIKYTLGHNQVAPGRKDDPWNFEWEKIGK